MIYRHKVEAPSLCRYIIRQGGCQYERILLNTQNVLSIRMETAEIMCQFDLVFSSCRFSAYADLTAERGPHTSGGPLPRL
jgi:hypothetical protein